MFDKHRDKKPNQARTADPGPAYPPATAEPSLQVTGKAAVIGPGITIDGDISGKENLLIEGKVKGRIHLAAHEVTVGQSGEVNADVSAKLIRVAGKVCGDMTAKEKIVINSTGNVRGNIVTPRILLEDGAIFKGSIDMGPGEAATAQTASSVARTAVKPGNPPELVAGAVKINPDSALKSG